MLQPLDEWIIKIRQQWTPTLFKDHIKSSQDLPLEYQVNTTELSFDSHLPTITQQRINIPPVVHNDCALKEFIQQGTNNNSPNTDQAEAADPTFFAADSLQPGEVHLHSWMLYTPQAPILNLTGEHIKTKEDIEAAFHSLNLCTHDEQKSDGTKGHKAKQSK